MNDIVWSVNIMIGVGLIMTGWFIYHILKLDADEEKNPTNSHSDTSHHE